MRLVRAQMRHPVFPFLFLFLGYEFVYNAFYIDNYNLKSSFVVRDENSMAKTVSFDDNIN